MSRLSERSLKGGKACFKPEFSSVSLGKNKAGNGAGLQPRRTGLVFMKADLVLTVPPPYRFGSWHGTIALPSGLDRA